MLGYVLGALIIVLGVYALGLLAYLALAKGRYFSRSELVSTLWADRAERAHGDQAADQEQGQGRGDGGPDPPAELEADTALVRTVPADLFDRIQDGARYLHQHFGADALPEVLAAKARGEGATVYKGRLVDIASIKQAEVIVRQAEMIAAGA